MPSALHWRPRKYWRDETKCSGSDPDLFVGKDGRHHTPRIVEQAKAVCGGCPVRAECLWWALAAGQKRGIYGGLTEEERQALSRAVPDPVVAMMTALNA